MSGPDETSGIPAPEPPHGKVMPPAAPRPAPRMEAPSADVAPAAPQARMPGAPRTGFLRLPTAPLGVTSTSAPVEPGTMPEVESDIGSDDGSGSDAVATPLWKPSAATPEPQRGVAGWALAFSGIGLAVSFFVGWGFPIGIVGTITAIVALRRPFESRAVACWALVIGIASVVYSAGWLLWAASSAGILG
ncbi:MAG: hypothetical protein KKH75_05940 [Actinobacteria bacterium]|nr:hypothetical protein [Actinomycetota bacterium]